MGFESEIGSGARRGAGISIKGRKVSLMGISSILYLCINNIGNIPNDVNGHDQIPLRI